MRKIIPALLIGMSLILSCKDNEVQEDNVVLQNDVVKASHSIPRNWDGCYRMIIGKDTAYLQLQQEDKTVKGPLVFRRAEKDANKGMFKGIITDTMIKGWYEFESEGTISVREIFFLTSGKNLAEGYGDIQLKGDTAVFRFPNSVKFEINYPFIPVACDSIKNGLNSR